MSYRMTYFRINTEGYIADWTTELKDMRVRLLDQRDNDSAAKRRIDDAIGILNDGSGEIAEWNESMIRQFMDTVKEQE